MNLHPIALAALELQRALEDFGRLFCFIGGLALQRWGQPRYTSDVDATLLTDWVDDEAASDRAGVGWEISRRSTADLRGGGFDRA